MPARLSVLSAVRMARRPPAELVSATLLKGRRFVLTSPNATAFQRLIGRDESVYEILDDDADVHAIVQAVREAAKARPTR